MNCSSGGNPAVGKLTAIASPPPACAARTSRFTKLSRAAAAVSLGYIGLLVAQLAWICAGEWALRSAARAACREALLPRATFVSAENMARAALGPRSPLANHLRFNLEIHRSVGAPTGELDLQSGDRVTVRLSAPGALAPAWLCRWGLPIGAMRLQAAPRASAGSESRGPRPICECPRTTRSRLLRRPANHRPRHTPCRSRYV